LDAAESHIIGDALKSGGINYYVIASSVVKVFGGVDGDYCTAERNLA